MSEVYLTYVSQWDSSFSPAHKVFNVSITTNFVFPHTGSFPLYLHQVMKSMLVKWNMIVTFKDYMCRGFSVGRVVSTAVNSFTDGASLVLG